MAKRSTTSKLAHKSIMAATAAVELYNKPRFEYKNESFVVLMVNAWELLLKAKLLQDNPKNQNIINIQSKKLTKSGTAPKRFYPEKNRTGNPKTIDIFGALKKVGVKDQNLEAQIGLLVELRDNSIHFLNGDGELNIKLFQIAAATTRSFVLKFREWFFESADLNSVLPISFSTLDEIIPISTEKKGALKNVLKHIKKVEKQKRPLTSHAVAYTVQVQLQRTYGMSTPGMSAKIDNANPKAISVQVTDVDLIKNKFKFDYAELCKQCKKRKPGIRLNPKFITIYKQVKQIEDLCYNRPIDPRKPKGSAGKSFFSEQAIDYILARI